MLVAYVAGASRSLWIHDWIVEVTWPRNQAKAVAPITTTRQPKSCSPVERGGIHGDFITIVSAL
jgi:hypothetical protein